MEKQELEQKFRMFEQQIMQIQEQLQAVDNAVLEMKSINSGLDAIVGKVDQEILAPMGRGVFVKAKLLSENLTVDVGNRNFVKKSIPETKELIDEQVGKLTEMKAGLETELNNINQELTRTMFAGQEAHECGGCAEGECSDKHEGEKCGNDCSDKKDDDCGCGC